MMNLRKARVTLATVAFAALTMVSGVAHAATDAETTKLFRNAGQSSHYFANSVGYAVFPTIGKGGLGIGAAHGTGSVYSGGKRIGTVSMNQISIGLQAGGEGYSQIIFFQNKAALDEFTSGKFEFSADVGAIAITAAASASAGTAGADAAASAGKHDASTAGEYTDGMAVFTIAKGGVDVQRRDRRPEVHLQPELTAARRRGEGPPPCREPASPVSFAAPEKGRVAQR